MEFTTVNEVVLASLCFFNLATDTDLPMPTFIVKAISSLRIAVWSGLLFEARCVRSKFVIWEIDKIIRKTLKFPPTGGYIYGCLNVCDRKVLNETRYGGRYNMWQFVLGRNKGPQEGFLISSQNNMQKLEVFRRPAVIFMAVWMSATVKF